MPRGTSRRHLNVRLPEAIKCVPLHLFGVRSQQYRMLNARLPGSHRKFNDIFPIIYRTFHRTGLPGTDATHTPDYAPATVMICVITREHNLLDTIT